LWGLGARFTDFCEDMRQPNLQTKMLCRKGSRAKLKYAETTYRHGTKPFWDV